MTADTPPVHCAEERAEPKAKSLDLPVDRCSSVIQEELGVEALLSPVERSQMRWIGHLVEMPPGRLPFEVFMACPSCAGEDLGCSGETISLCWSGNTLGSPPEVGGSMKRLGRGECGIPWFGSCPATQPRIRGGG